MSTTSLFLFSIFAIFISPSLAGSGSPWSDIIHSPPVSLSEFPSAKSCLEGLPERYLRHCHGQAQSRYQNTLLVAKRHCCARWIQLTCLENYVFNSIYCSQHQQDSMKHYIERLHMVTRKNPLGQCANYPPIELEKLTLKPELGEVARCVPQGIL